MCKIVYSVSVYVFLCFLTVKCQLQEGDKCFSKSDDLAGTCVHLRRCLSSLNDIRTKRYPQLCSFRGEDPIICCTDCELVDDVSNYLVDLNGRTYRKTGSKSQDKCQEYIVKLEYPCPRSGGLKRTLYYNNTCYDYEVPVTIQSVGGRDALRHQFAHMALLGFGDRLETAQWLCGGSVISEKFILTAAHCVFSNSIGTVKYVALGILKRTDPPEYWQRYNVRRSIRHPEYKPPSKYNDIALLEVDRRIDFNKDVLPACLNTGGSYEKMATATGWGSLGPRQALADTLQVVDLEEFSAEECSAAYPRHRLLANGYNHASQSCYGDKNNRIIDTCEGDSGGPLQVPRSFRSCMYIITGVTSFGRQCGVAGNSGIYTRVEFYVPWIESIVWP